MSKDRQRPDWPYYDIVDLPHHVSTAHPQMDLLKRAAQFAPFAALTGYDDAIEESARLTEEMPALDEDAMEELNRRITEAAERNKEIQLTCFVPDQKKSGGSFAEITGRVKKFEIGQIIMEDGKRIPVENVVRIEVGST